MAKLTAKRRAFVEAYTGNAAEAALRAGYSLKRAHSIGHELLKKPEIQSDVTRRDHIKKPQTPMSTGFVAWRESA